MVTGHIRTAHDHWRGGGEREREADRQTKTEERERQTDRQTKTEIET